MSTTAPLPHHCRHGFCSPDRADFWRATRAILKGAEEHARLRGLAFKPIYMSDAIHSNDEGCKRIAARLEKTLRPLVPKLTGETPAR